MNVKMLPLPGRCATLTEEQEILALRILMRRALGHRLLAADDTQELIHAIRDDLRYRGVIMDLPEQALPFWDCVADAALRNRIAQIGKELKCGGGAWESLVGVWKPLDQPMVPMNPQDRPLSVKYERALSIAYLANRYANESIQIAGLFSLYYADCASEEERDWVRETLLTVVEPIMQMRLG